MSRFLSLTALLAGLFMACNAHAQTDITITNTTNCDVLIQFSCGDTAGTCNQCSNNICMSPGTVVYTFCSATCSEWTSATVCVRENFGCTGAFCTNAGPACASVGWYACSGQPTTGSIVTDATCNDCAGQTLNISATGTWDLNIN